MAKREIPISGSKEFDKFYKSHNLNNDLKNYIDEAMDSLKVEPNIGDKIEKNHWPKKYVKKFGITNLFRYAIGSNWRMIYTIMSDGKEITCLILEVLQHKEYDKRFGYHTS